MDSETRAQTSAEASSYFENDETAETQAHQTRLWCTDKHFYEFVCVCEHVYGLSCKETDLVRTGSPIRYNFFALRFLS